MCAQKYSSLNFALLPVFAPLVNLPSRCRQAIARSSKLNTFLFGELLSGLIIDFLALFSRSYTIYAIPITLVKSNGVVSKPLTITCLSYILAGVPLDQTTTSVPQLSRGDGALRKSARTRQVSIQLEYLYHRILRTAWRSAHPLLNLLFIHTFLFQILTPQSSSLSNSCPT